MICKDCKGNKTINQKVKIEQEIEPGCAGDLNVLWISELEQKKDVGLKKQIENGSANKKIYTHKGEGDQEYDTVQKKVIYGDVIIEVNIKPNPIFKRRINDLYMDKQITLLEAIQGVDFTIQHLDGFMKRVKTEEGSTVDPGAKMIAEGLGMPYQIGVYDKTKPLSYGNLVITFRVAFPDVFPDVWPDVMESSEEIKDTAPPTENDNKPVILKEFKNKEKHDVYTVKDTQQDRIVETEENGNGEMNCITQ